MDVTFKEWMQVLAWMSWLVAIATVMSQLSWPFFV